MPDSGKESWGSNTGFQVNLVRWVPRLFRGGGAKIQAISSGATNNQAGTAQVCNGNLAKG
jgi:hypothetical protein